MPEFNYQNVRMTTTSISKAPEKLDHKTGPSRVDCEKSIRRILMTENLQNGKNLHFKNSSDFMPFFESLYPAGASLQKQVQRAIRSMNLAKDKDGFYLIDRTKDQLSDDKDIQKLLISAGAENPISSEMESVFLPLLDADSELIHFLSKKISDSISFKDKYIAIIPAANGILFLTTEKDRLLLEINSALNPS